MLPLARFQSSRTADADTLARAFVKAGFAPARVRSRARRAYRAGCVHAGRSVRIEGGWSAGRTSDVPVLTVTLQAPLSGGRFRSHQTIPRDSPLPVPGDPTLFADGAPRSGLTAALAGTLGQDLAAIGDETDGAAWDEAERERLAELPSRGADDRGPRLRARDRCGRADGALNAETAP